MFARGVSFQVRPTQERIEETKAPGKVFMDEQGRVIDEQGNIVNVRQQKELMVNTKNVKETRTRDLERIMRSAKQNTLSLVGQKRKFFDSTLD